MARDVVAGRGRRHASDRRDEDHGRGAIAARARHHCRAQPLTMNLIAWCGYCGESFRLEELVAAGYTGRCPRCGEDLSPGYAPVASATVHELMAAAASLEVAAAQLRDVAPRLHID